MKTLLLLMCIVPVAESSFSQSLIDSTKKSNLTIAMTAPDSVNGKKDTTLSQKDVRETIIKVNPQEASDAAITIVQKSQIILKQYGVSTNWCGSDTLGIWNAPLVKYLSLDEYDFVVKKEGFKEVTERIEIATKQKYNISIEIFSLKYLQHKREQWRNIKWVNAAIASGTCIASYYFHSKINTYKNEYDNAITSDVIRDKRDSINKSRAYYRISSGIAFTAIGGFTVSWLVESFY